jgi:hypothetical protein
MPVRFVGREPASVRISYMGCGDMGCLPPVVNRRVAVSLPFVPDPLQ